ncbi:hypothetical protein ACFCWG_06595 [Streptomyces sp. NPDC056390]|uniref:hypothetical protein n=1 Tax=Streptomyces sp. NPDC056390 TaxID=3345806 RepID=UPI0035DC58D7
MADLSTYTASVADSHADEGYRDLARAEDGTTWSRTRALGKLAIDGGEARVAVWIGEPAAYPHGGATGGEAFVVTSGRGSIEIDGLGVFELAPGTVVVVPPLTASKLTVTETLRKVAFASGSFVSKH